MTQQQAHELCSRIQREDQRFTASVVCRYAHPTMDRGYKVAVRFPRLQRQALVNSLLEEWNSFQNAWQWF